VETLPKVKTQRLDVIRQPEVKSVIEQAEPWLACMIALAIIFGKRISEIIRLKRNEVYWDDTHLYVRFLVGKRRKQKGALPEYFLKRITLQHELTKYVLDYVSTIKDGFIFSFDRAEQKIHLTIKEMDGRIYEPALEYDYVVPRGFMSRQLAYYYLKKIAPDWWWHLCRETLATRMAEKGASEEDLMHWFDWETPTSPHKYVKRGTKLTEKYSERTW